MVQVPPTPSTRRLSEVARHLVYPTGIVSSGWPRIKQRLADMAVEYDGWQQGAAQLILGRDEHDRYAVTVGGVTMSIPRQVGKTFTIGSLLIAMCLEYPGLRVVWTSHHLRTTTNTFRAMQGMVKRKRIAPHLAHNGIRTANGEQEIKFANGSIIMFGAREHGFGVGIDAIDVLVCDEAQRLSSRALADMMPTTNQARHAHGALVFFIGTPPRPTDAGDEFAARRRKALEGKMLSGIYIELSADEDADLDDPKQWARANASYPHRTPHESMLRLRENLTDDDDWRREALGIWGTDDKASLIMPNWPACVTSEPPPAPVALGVAVDLDRVWASLAASSGGDRPHLGSVIRVRLAQQREMFVAEAARISKERRIPVALVAKGPAGTLEQELRDAGADVRLITHEEYVQACADLYDSVESIGVEHGAYADLDAAVEAAAWSAGVRRVWSWRGGDVSMLEAGTVARHAALQSVGATPSAYFV